MLKSIKDKWLIHKGYLHLDIPFLGKSKAKLKSYVLNKDMVVHHSFLPLMRKEMISFPFKSNRYGKRKMKKKIRKLTYASHTDAAIFGYYAEQLQTLYEKYIQGHGFSDVVTAYRKIECESHYGNKCNIDFAYDVFEFIKQHLQDNFPLAVITFDIKGFFDNLDHKYLKGKWLDILGLDKMPDDMYAVYKHTIRYSYVNEKDIFDLFSDSIYCRDNSGNGLVQKKVKRKKYLRDKKAMAYCMKKDINLIREKGLIRTRKYTESGIPQGLPISAILANVYMIDFDRDISKLLDSVGGLYRRYSDDIAIVCPYCLGKYFKHYIINEIKDVKLKIEEHKTNTYCFVKEGRNVSCLHETKGKHKVLEYLGFSFDGTRILLKNSSVSKFYCKMYKAVDRCVYYAVHIHNKTKGVLFEHGLISRFTFAGSKRNCQFNADKIRKMNYFHVKRHGNYLSYVRKSALIMNEDGIKKQLRRCTSKLSKAIKKAKVSITLNI